MRREEKLLQQEPACPWTELDLAPSLLRLLESEARQWVRDADLAEEILAAVLTLTRGDHQLLRQITIEAVVSGRCRAGDGLALLAATACDRAELGATLELADGAWWREVRFGTDAVGADEPGLTGIRLWPLHEVFPDEALPPAWQAWADLASQAALGSAARAILGHQMMLVSARRDGAEERA